MWEQKLFELFVTIIPQSFAFVLLYFSLMNIEIKPKIYLLTSVAFAVATFIIRPFVNFGVHSIILLFLLVFIVVKWRKANLLWAVIYGTVPFIVGYISEWITFIFLGVIKFDLDLLSTSPQIRALVGIIPLSITFAVSFAVYFIKKNVNKSKGDNNAAV